MNDAGMNDADLATNDAVFIDTVLNHAVLEDAVIATNDAVLRVDAVMNDAVIATNDAGIATMLKHFLRDEWRCNEGRRKSDE